MRDASLLATDRITPSIANDHAIAMDVDETPGILENLVSWREHYMVQGNHTIHPNLNYMQ
jgi:hypothetical protein